MRVAGFGRRLASTLLTHVVGWAPTSFIRKTVIVFGCFLLAIPARIVPLHDASNFPHDTFLQNFLDLSCILVLEVDFQFLCGFLDRQVKTSQLFGLIVVADPEFGQRRCRPYESTWLA